jgi:hypothetical protein
MTRPNGSSRRCDRRYIDVPSMGGLTEALGFFTAQGALAPDPERRIEDGQQAGLASAFGSCAPGCNCKSLVRPANPRNLFIGTSPKILLGRVHSVMPLVLCHSF